MSFGQRNVDEINARFKKLLEEPAERKIRAWHCAGLSNGWTTSGRVLYIGATFTVGKFVSVDMLGLDQYKVLATSFILFTSFMSTGQQTTNIPSMQKAKEAAGDIFSIIDEPSTLDIRVNKEDTIHDLGPGRI